MGFQTSNALLSNNRIMGYTGRQLKSITGVIVAGPAAIHSFDDDFAFCSECRTRGCRKRIREVRGEIAPD